MERGSRRALLRGIAGLAAGLALPVTVTENVEATRRYWPGWTPAEIPGLKAWLKAEDFSHPPFVPFQWDGAEDTLSLEPDQAWVKADTHDVLYHPSLSLKVMEGYVAPDGVFVITMARLHSVSVIDAKHSVLPADLVPQMRISGLDLGKLDNVIIEVTDD